MCVQSKFDRHRTTKPRSCPFDSDIAYREFFPYIYLPPLRDETRYRSASIGNREGRLFPSGGASKIGKPIKRDNPSPRSVEDGREYEAKEKEDDEGRGKRVVKTSSVLRMGRKCLIAVRGSSRRWRNWFRGAYRREKMNGPYKLSGSGAGGYPRELVNVSICTADN